MGRKPKKKSKKQLEDELQKASVELKRQEEKERLLKLEEDFRKTICARLAEEEDSREKVLEAERLEEESIIVARMKTQRRKDLDYERSKLQDRINWNKFISCSSRPNVKFESEITTYMTMLGEQQTNQMEAAVAKCRESEEVVNDLLEVWCKAKEEGDALRQEWCMRYIYELRAQEMDICDGATAYQLQTIGESSDVNDKSQVSFQWGEADHEIKVGLWGYLLNKGFRQKTIDHQQLQILLDLPRSIALHSPGQCIGVRSLYTVFDSVAGKDPSVVSVGGMIRVDLLLIPPFSRRVKGWTLRQVPPPGRELVKLAYPNTDNQSATQTTTGLMPCKIEYKVPRHVLVRYRFGETMNDNRKDVTVSWWDKDDEKWSTEGITEIVWEPEGRRISFLSQRLAAFAITQPRHLDLPYERWSMRPVGPLECELEIIAAHYELRFIITEDGLRLKEAQDRQRPLGTEMPELSGVMYTYELDGGVLDGNPANPRDFASPPDDSSGAERLPRVRSPATLLLELRECGLNLMPEATDADFLEGYSFKDPATNGRACSDLSEIAASHDIVSSKHNKGLPKEQILVRTRPNPLREKFDPWDPDCDTDYQAILFFPDKSCLVASIEQVSPCKTSNKPGHLTHASLYLCHDRTPTPLPDHAEQLQKLEVTCSNVRYVEAVRQTLQLMQLLSFV